MTAHLHHTGGPLTGETPIGYAHEILVEGPPNPTSLVRGSFVYLWAPGERPWSGERPILARVEKATVDTIVALDLSSGSRAQYGVGKVYPVGLRWQWELAAPPERASVPVGCEDGIAVVDRRTLTMAARRELMFGAPGTTVRITTVDGGSYVGVPTLVVCDQDEYRVEWVKLQGPTDSRGAITHAVRFDHIAGVTLVGEVAA